MQDKKETLETLCLQLIKAELDWTSPRMGERQRELENIIWGRLKPFLRRLSRTMAKKSAFRENSIWVLSVEQYIGVIIESFNHKTKVVSIRPRRLDGAVLIDSLYLPCSLEDMEDETLENWALENDERATPPPESPLSSRLTL